MKSLNEENYKRYYDQGICFVCGKKFWKRKPGKKSEGGRKNLGIRRSDSKECSKECAKRIYWRDGKRRILQKV